MREMITINKSSSNFFDQLVSFVISAASLAPVIELQNDRNVSKWLPNQSLILEPGKAFKGFQLRLYPSQIFVLVSKNIWPTQMQIIKEPEAQFEGNGPISINCLQRVHATLIESSFSQYYENYKLDIIKIFGKDCNKWPSEWNFARIVRNAFSHGGRIKIDNPNANKVSWKNLDYDFHSNGKALLYNDLTAVELIYLMIEMDNYLVEN